MEMDYDDVCVKKSGGSLLLQYKFCKNVEKENDELINNITNNAGYADVDWIRFTKD